MYFSYSETLLCDLALQRLLLSLYKSFSKVLTERLPSVSADGEMPNLRAEGTDSMAIDLEEPSTMEMDHDNGTKDDR